MVINVILNKIIFIQATNEDQENHTMEEINLTDDYSFISKRFRTEISMEVDKDVENEFNESKKKLHNEKQIEKEAEAEKLLMFKEVSLFKKKFTLLFIFLEFCDHELFRYI